MIIWIKNNVRVHIFKSDLMGFLLFLFRFFHLILPVFHIKNRAEYEVPASRFSLI